MENIPYHFMIKVKSEETQAEYYYDINGRHNEDNLEPYIATILGRDPKVEVGITSRTNQARKIDSNNKVALHCEKDIIEQPYMISSGVFNRNKKI